MSQPPVVLVVIRNSLQLGQLMSNLKAHGIAAFGTSSLDEAVRLMGLLGPEIVVIDPTSEECYAVLDDMNAGWQSIALVAVVETEEAAQRARELGIEDVIMAEDASAAANAVLDMLQQVSPPVSSNWRHLRSEN